jgi:predicted dehydrogenase
MVGGGPGAFIGAVHRMAARLDDHFELVASALASNPARSRAAARELHIAPDRAYGSYLEMASLEKVRSDRIDAVAIVTPNNLHGEIAKNFLAAGIHVVCEKPLGTSVQEELELAELVRRTGLLFALTHNYTGYPMVRQARQMVRDGELGNIRVVQVEYAQDWLSTPLELTGHKQAAWRTDPVQSGPAGCLGDIGTHAFNIVSFVTGLVCQQVAADLFTFVPGRHLDDNVQVLLRFEGGSRGALWASQVAVGHLNGLRLRIFGDKAGLEWEQEEPNSLCFTPLAEPPTLIRRSAAGVTSAAQSVSRLPGGHPEGYIEAFAQIYSDVAEQITARLIGREAQPASLLVPGIEDGMLGMRFVRAVLESSRRNGMWVDLDDS